MIPSNAAEFHGHPKHLRVDSGYFGHQAEEMIPMQWG
jgi:hypothetical protein